MSSSWIIFGVLSAAVACMALPCIKEDSAGPCENPWGDAASGPFSAALCNSPNRPFLRLNVTKGKIPSWLSGTLYRNIPSKFTWGPDQVEHWFDGWSQVNAITLDGELQSAHIRAKMANTSGLHRTCTANRYNVKGAFTYPYPGPLTKPNASRHSDHGIPGVVNNDVSFLDFGGRFLQTTDAPEFVEIDEETLDVKTPDGWVFNDTLGHSIATMSATHGSVDDQTQEYFNMVSSFLPTVFGGNATIYFYKVNGTNAKETKRFDRTIVGSFQLPYGPYTHSLGTTENYIVWFENPLHVDADLEPKGIPIMRTLVPTPRENETTANLTRYAHTKIHTIHRRTGAHRVYRIPDPDFGWLCHTGNVYEDPSDGSIVYDGSHSASLDLYNRLETKFLVTGKAPPSSAARPMRLARCRLFPDNDASCVDIDSIMTQKPLRDKRPQKEDAQDDFERLLATNAQTFPWYNKRFHQKPYRYAYSTTLMGPTFGPGNVTKWDMESNRTVATFTPSNLWLTEAIFMQRNHSSPPPTPSGSMFPSRADEDDGILLTVAFNFKTNTSLVIGLHPAHLTVSFEVQLPFALSMHFHGIFCTTRSSKGRYCVWN